YVHVFTGVAGVNEHQRVPMIRRGYGHGVQVLGVEQGAVVIVFPGVGARLFDGKFHVIVAEVAYSDRLVIAMLEKRVRHLVAAIPKADIAHADAVIGSADPGISGGRGQGGAFSKIPTGKMAHKSFRFNRRLTTVLPIMAYCPPSMG